MDLEIVEGLVPSVLATLNGSESIYGEAGIMLYKEPPVGVGRKTVKSAGLLAGMERVSVGGMPFFLTEFTGPGHVAFSRDGVGEIRILEIPAGREIDIVEGSLLCASNSIGYAMEYVKGTHRPGRIVGFWLDRLSGPGKVAIHGYGNIISMTLAPKETITTDLGALLYKDAGVQAKTANLPFGSGLLGKFESFEVLELTGPGQVALQSIDPKQPHY